MKLGKVYLALACGLLAGCNLPAATNPPAADPSTGCYYVWATRPLPDLSQEIDTALQKMDPAVTGSAYAFGEDCVYADGHADFGAMETDYRVTVQVDTLKDLDLLGNWIRRVVPVIEGMPPADVPGPQPGRVEFIFEKNKNEQLIVQVPIREFQGLPADLTGAELLRHFRPSP